MLGHSISFFLPLSLQFILIQRDPELVPEVVCKLKVLPLLVRIGLLLAVALSQIAEEEETLGEFNVLVKSVGKAVADLF